MTISDRIINWLSSKGAGNKFSSFFPGTADKLTSIGATALDKRTDVFQDNHTREFMQKYGLGDEYFDILFPLFAHDSGMTTEGILNYIQQLQVQRKNEIDSADDYLKEVSRQAAAGLNSALNGTGSSALDRSNPVPAADLNSPSSFASRGGSVSLAQRAAATTSELFKVISFGLQTYSIVTNSLERVATSIGSAAAEDVAGLVGDDKGIIQDLPGAIRDLVSTRGLTGRKAKLYSSEVASKINSLPVVLKRMQDMSSLEESSRNFKINRFKNSDSVLEHTFAFIKDSEALQSKMAAYDLEIQEKKLQWLSDHPDSTAQELDAALAGTLAESREKVANADMAESGARRAVTEERIAGINEQIAKQNLEQEEIETESKRSNWNVQKLQDEIRLTELSGIKEMMTFCRTWENAKSEYDGAFDMGLTLPEYHENERKYKAKKKFINEYWNHKDDSPRFKIGGKFASVSF